MRVTIFLDTSQLDEFTALLEYKRHTRYPSYTIHAWTLSQLILDLVDSIADLDKLTIINNLPTRDPDQNRFTDYKAEFDDLYAALV